MTWRSANPNLWTRPGRTQQMDLPNRRFRSRCAGKFGWCVPGAGCPVPGSRCPVSSPLFIYVFYRHIFLRPLHKNASGGLAPNNTLRPQKKTKLFERRALRCCSAIGGEIRTSMPTSENAHTHVCSMNRRAQQWHLGP